MKKTDIDVHWLDGTVSTFPAVRLKSMVGSNDENKAAVLSFKYGKGEIAVINIDNIKCFNVKKTCTED